jgi:FAD/FMN-containing dehydrogenase
MWNALEDASHYQGFADQIHAPETEDALLALLAEAQAKEIPVTIAGGGSGLTGGRCPEGGWSISMEKFQRLEIHSGYAVAGAGVLLRDLHAAAKASGQFYPPDPTEVMAAIGGTISCNASGSRSFLYGSTKRWVRRLRVAFLNGTQIDVRRGDPIGFEVSPVHRPRSTKHSAGYPLAPDMDWIELISGSEGTLGVVLEAELDLLPWPKNLLNGIVFFSSDEDCLRAIDAWREIPGLRMLEYVDEPSLNLIRPKYSDMPAQAVACVIVEQIAEDDSVEFDSVVDAWLDRLTEQNALAEESWFGDSDADRERFREFRHTLPEYTLDLVRRLGLPKLGSDFAVPVDRNRDMLAYYRSQIGARFPAPHVIYGHIGDAHVHVNLFPNSPETAEEGKRLMRDFAMQAVALGGTVAAEHGLGKRKRDFLPLMFSPAEIEAMKQVKRRLDPKWLLGQGNLFPLDAPLASAPSDLHADLPSSAAVPPAVAQS